MEKTTKPQSENKEVDTAKSKSNDNLYIGDVEELTKELQNEEKLLERLTNSDANKSVIEAQKTAVEEAKRKLNEAQNFEDLSQKRIAKGDISFSIVDEETGKATTQNKRIAFVTNNRPVNSKKVNDFTAVIANNKYDKAFPIIAMEASKVIEHGYKITDIKGNKIAKDDISKYLVILDGQHRVTAFAKLFATDKYHDVIPNVHLRDVTNVGEYLVDINNVGNSWDRKDKLTVAALTTATNKDLFENIASLIKEGFNPSTACLIFTGKGLTEKQINKVLKGEEIKLPSYTNRDIERGNKFVTLCHAAQIDVKFITKRYFIKGFNSYASATSEEQAFEALDKLKYLKYDSDKWKKVKHEDHFTSILRTAMDNKTE